MSKKYLTGSKRLQIIQRWLNGVDDPEYDVFPTRKEGKYIVKPRKTTMTTDINEEPTEKTEQEQEPIELEQDEPIEQPKITPKTKQITRPKAKQQTNLNTSYQTYDPTINIEILNQLKLLGEEFKLKREKKEQKRMIKEVVQKQIAKPRMQYNYTEPDYSQQSISIGNSLNKVKPNQDEEMIEQPQPTLTRRRNNIFADIM
ncbi:hypothetical protein M9Y10_013877 [Tritrichomonas musculus]|uniref:Uncharacterized protein n=1 Tax=Tritrichomonas musculus TaxID=1915356 RepID=A0ABR2KY04_9EUKA